MPLGDVVEALCGRRCGVEGRRPAEAPARSAHTVAPSAHACMSGGDGGGGGGGGETGPSRQWAPRRAHALSCCLRPVAGCVCPLQLRPPCHAPCLVAGGRPMLGLRPAFLRRPPARFWRPLPRARCVLLRRPFAAARAASAVVCESRYLRTTACLPTSAKGPDERPALPAHNSFGLFAPC